jgi:hypothetical protein
MAIVRIQSISKLDLTIREELEKQKPFVPYIFVAL